MGWGIGIPIGWPNATSGGGTPIIYESYQFYNCVAEEYNSTNQYPVGTFTTGDRVLINGGNAYGYLLEPILPTTSGYTLLDLPINQISINRPCLDSNITIGILANIGETGVITCNIGANITGLVVDNNTGSFPISFNIDWTAEIADGEGSVATLEGAKKITFATNVWPIGSSIIAENVLLSEGIPGWSTDALTASINGFEIENSYVFETGWNYPNKYITTFGNTWQFQYPTGE